MYNDQPVPEMDVIIRNVKVEFEKLVDKKIKKLSFGDANIPVKATTTQKQPSGFKPGLKLYKYQLDAITWMKSIEDQNGMVFINPHHITITQSLNDKIFLMPCWQSLTTLI